MIFAHRRFRVVQYLKGRDVKLKRSIKEMRGKDELASLLCYFISNNPKTWSLLFFFSFIVADLEVLQVVSVLVGGNNV